MYNFLPSHYILSNNQRLDIYDYYYAPADLFHSDQLIDFEIELDEKTHFPTWMEVYESVTIDLYYEILGIILQHARQQNKA